MNIEQKQTVDNFTDTVVGLEKALTSLQFTVDSKDIDSDNRHQERNNHRKDQTEETRSRNPFDRYHLAIVQRNKTPSHIRKGINRVLLYWYG